MVICITQPRRVAAVTVATRVAEERVAVLGHEVRKPDVSIIELLLSKNRLEMKAETVKIAFMCSPIKKTTSLSCNQ